MVMTGTCSWHSHHDNNLSLCLLVQGDTIQDIQQLFKGLSLPVRVDKLVRAIKQWRDRAVQDRNQPDAGEEALKVEPQDEIRSGAKPESGSGDRQQTESGNDVAKVKNEPVVDVRTDCQGAAGDVSFRLLCMCGVFGSTDDCRWGMCLSMACAALLKWCPARLIYLERLGSSH